jgi:hypothetical protein
VAEAAEEVAELTTELVLERAALAEDEDEGKMISQTKGVSGFRRSVAFACWGTQLSSQCRGFKDRKSELTLRDLPRVEYIAALVLYSPCSRYICHCHCQYRSIVYIDNCS